jgi:hypothetical protein
MASYYNFYKDFPYPLIISVSYSPIYKLQFINYIYIFPYSLFLYLKLFLPSPNASPVAVFNMYFLFNIGVN